MRFSSLVMKASILGPKSSMRWPHLQVVLLSVCNRNRRRSIISGVGFITVWRTMLFFVDICLSPNFLSGDKIPCEVSLSNLPHRLIPYASPTERNSPTQGIMPAFWPTDRDPDAMRPTRTKRPDAAIADLIRREIAIFGENSLDGSQALSPP